MHLAREKALSLLHDSIPLSAQIGTEQACVILSADTIVVNEQGQWLGQPESRAAAETILRTLLHATHQVVTGVALVKVKQNSLVTHERTFADSAHVAWGDVCDSTLQTYLDSGDWQGKAGGYNLFELQQRHWPITHTGDPTTIVGLPMQALVPRLEALKVTRTR